jgi:DNA-binding IclR family transcriptional regulator
MPRRTESGLRSVENALTTLDYLASQAPRAVRVTDVAGHLGLSLAAASRLLATLAEAGYASRTTDRRFTVGPRSMPLAGAWLASLRAAAADPVALASSVTGESVMLAQMLGDTLSAVTWHPHDKRGGELSARLEAVGPSFPAWATACGRAMLGKMPAARRPKLLPRGPLPRLTERTLASGAEVLERVKDGARIGLHIERGEVLPDLWCCAVALEPGPSGEILALSVISFDEPDADRRTRIHKTLRHQVHEVAARVAGLPAPA